MAESEGQGLLPFGEEDQGLSNRSQPMGINSSNWPVVEAKGLAP